MIQTKSSMRMLAFISWMGLVILSGCQTDNEQISEPLARPVSYIPLKLAAPKNHSHITGSVMAWKKESVGFDVNGRVKFVEEPGTIVHGNLFNKEGQIVEPGSLLASLQDSRYQLHVDQAKANIDAIRATVQQAQVSYKRQLDLLEQGAGAQQYVDDALARLRTSKAQLRTAEDDLREAKLNSADTTLLAPFSGEIAKSHVIPGGYVERGNPVVTLQMMDPIKVAVAVSADIEKQINYNDLAQVYIGDEQAPMQGWVWNKSPVADASTRTFIVTMLVRNRRHEVGISEDMSSQNITRTYSLQNLEPKQINGRTRYFINSDCVHEDEKGHFIWKVDGLTIKDLMRDFNPVFKAQKVRIELGQTSYPFMQIFTYIEVDDIGSLKPETDLIVGKLSNEIEDGEKVALSRERWLLRPGQIVNVDLKQNKLAKGLYVPAQSIVKKADKQQVYIVKNNDNGEQYAQAVEVTTGSSNDTLIEIIPVNSDDLKGGEQIIVDGANYLKDGDLIKAYASIEVKL